VTFGERRLSILPNLAIRQYVVSTIDNHRRAVV
jgi:hypothetical protein